MENCFTASARPLAAARGIYRVSFLAAAIFIALALLSLETIGSGFFVCTLVALWFSVIAVWQLRLARRLAASVLMLDGDGVMTSFGTGEQFFPAQSVCLRHGAVARSAGFGKQYRVCRAVMICDEVVIVDIETTARVKHQPVSFSGPSLPLDADEYERLLQLLKTHGWDRPCTEKSKVPERRRIPLLRFAYASGIIPCILAWLLLDNPRLGMAFLLAALGLGGLFLNSFYSRNGHSSPETPAHEE